MNICNGNVQKHRAPLGSKPLQGSLLPPTSSRLSNPDSSTLITERIVYVPRERKCPVFRGNLGVGIEEWVEEGRSCMRARCLSTIDQAYFIYDHLEGEAKHEIKFRSRVDREDPERIFAILQELWVLTVKCSTTRTVLFWENSSKTNLYRNTLIHYWHSWKK